MPLDTLVYAVWPDACSLWLRNGIYVQAIGKIACLPAKDTDLNVAKFSFGAQWPSRIHFLICKSYRLLRYGRMISLSFFRLVPRARQLGDTRTPSFGYSFMYSIASVVSIVNIRIIKDTHSIHLYSIYIHPSHLSIDASSCAMYILENMRLSCA